MRLTLRTMLAYLDDILEKPDAQELEQKIEGSKFASELVQRIRSSTHRARLGAPKLDGAGMAADANTVAEYLDNVMPAEHVPEFEKVCLESDVHLAEVASAHQILTLVLGEPAVFDGAIRERIYALAHGAPHRTPASGTDGGNGAAVVGDRQHSATEAPAAAGASASGDGAAAEGIWLPRSWTQSTSFPWTVIAITLLLGFGLAVGALRMMGEFGPAHPLIRWFRGTDSVADAKGVAESPGQQGAQVQQPATDQTPAASPAPPSPAAEPSVADRSKPAGQQGPETTTSGTPNVGSVAQPLADRPAEPPSATPVPIPDPPPPADIGVSAGPATVDPGTPPAPSKLPIDPFDGKPVETPPADRESRPVPSPPTDRNFSPIISTPVDVGSVPITAGRYLSEEQVLARLDKVADDPGTWMALAVNSTLIAGDELMSLPAFRPQVLVSQGVKMTLSGEAYLKLHVPDADNVPRVTFHYGRASLVPVGDMGGQIRIDAGGRNALLTFGDAESEAAIEIRWYLAPGADPTNEPARLAVRLWAARGSIEWQERDRSPVKVIAGQSAWFLDESELTVLTADSLPGWIAGTDVSDIDRRASQELKKHLVVGRPLTLSLMEQTTSRHVEVRSLSRRALCQLEFFEPALESLEDERHRSYWPAELDALRDGLARGEEGATRLRASVAKLFGDQAVTVFRMLSGYSPEGLSAGGATELVEALTSPSMAIRVLAYENLRRITGKSLPFRPEARPDQERSKVIKWRKILEDGQVSYTTPPSPFPALPAGGP